MKKILSLFSLLFVAINCFAQLSPSQNENYTLSTSYLDENGTKKIQGIQYYDGLGRKQQSIAIKTTPLGNDLVVPHIYDDYGRKIKNYLPISKSSSNGAIQGNIDEVTVNNYYGSTNAFSENEFESVSFGRLKQSAFPGDDWIKNGGNTIRQEYDINKTTDDVKKYITIATWDNTTKMYTSSIPSVGSYGAGELYKFKVIDEDENEKYVFKDKLGRIILSRKNDGNNFVDTYYIYNDYNQLSYIIPPLASVKTNLSQAILDELCYQYRYDESNREVEKKLPGKGLDISTGIWGWEYMIYDNQDRLVMMQDATLGKNKEWLFTKYDQFGRKAYTGIYTSLQAYNSTGRYFEQVQINGKGNNNVARTTSSFVQPGLLVYYDNDATKNYPNAITKLLTVNYYDTYPADKPNLTTLAFTQTLISDIATTKINTKGLPVASYVNNIESNGWTKSFAWYDSKGRSIASYTKNVLGHYTQTESFPDFAGVVQKMITKHRRKSTDAVLVINDDFIYDNQNRLKKHFHEVVGKTPKELLAEYTYDEIGQLTEKKVGADQYGNNPIQTINYSYNIRGWNTGINLDANGNFQAGKMFNYKINYNNTLEITNTKPDVSNQALEVKKKFNGNIAEVTWQFGGVPNPEVKKYGYVYDGLDRLRAGFYYQKSGSTYLFTEEHNELPEYDLNGNITKLKRFAYKIGNLPNKIDDLTYSYTGGNGNSNTLLSVTDSGNASGYEGGGSQISYDSNGNMTAMPDKGITISYNYLDLPINISRGAKNISEYRYRADGTKIKKTTTFINKMGTSIINTEYFGGFQYSTPNTDPLSKALNAKDDATMELTRAGEEEAFTKDLERAIVVDPGNPSADNMVLSFFPTSEGYYDFENLRYIYQYKDQVGNIRVSYTKDPSTGLAKSLDKNDYYPFGMSHLKSVPSLYDPMSVPYNYKFGGKELQETGFYDFGARMLMPDLGRWFAIDPLAELSPDLTPFRYAFNNPISYTDPNGMYEDDGGPGDEWANKGYDAFFERDGDYGGDNFAADMMADLSAEYHAEMQDGEFGLTPKQRDIEDAKERSQLEFDIAREEADVRSHGIEVGCCPNPVITLGEIAAEGTTSFSRAGVIGVTWYVVNGLFGSAHIPADPMTVGIAYNNIKTLADIKDAVSSPAVKSRGNQIGSYTIIFNNNQKYHGKGPLPRMMLSAAQHSIANKVMVKSMQWTPSATDRQAFKDEYRRMQTDAVLPTYPQGVDNPINYNIRQSPGYLYIQQDGF